MRPITHGEIRGSLLLLLLMAAIVILTYLTDNDPGKIPGSTPGAVTDTSPTPEQIDSIRLEESASRYGRADSIARSKPQSPHKPKRKSPRKSPRPVSSPTPSPLDRPIP